MYGGATAFAEFPFATTALPKASPVIKHTPIPKQEREAPQNTFLNARPAFLRVGDITFQVATNPSFGALDQEVADESEASEVSQTANARSVLLAMKYGDGLQSKEQAARLVILTARLRNLVPSVTPDHWAALESATDYIEAADLRLQQLRARIAEL